MNLRQVLHDAREMLRGKDIEDASLEAEILLRHVLETDRAGLFSQLEREISPEDASRLRRLLERRLRGEPVAYITGHREFFGLDFLVDRRVLIPRPETELLVEKAVSLAAAREIKTIADIGTGSGAVAVSVAVNLPDVTVYAVDVSSSALEIAAGNCRKHGVIDRVSLLHGNLLEPLPERVDMIMANPPYVRTADLQAQKELEFEPVIALHGGDDGLEVIRALVRQAGAKLNRSGSLLVEIGRGQVEQIVPLLQESFPRAVTEVFTDYSGIERVVSLSLT